jgi:hypothetical protein
VGEEEIVIHYDSAEPDDVCPVCCTQCVMTDASEALCIGCGTVWTIRPRGPRTGASWHGDYEVDPPAGPEGVTVDDHRHAAVLGADGEPDGAE